MWIHIPKECFPFAPDTEGLSSLSSLPELPPELCATSNEKSIQPRTWRRLWKKAMWIRLLSGMTLPPSTRVLGVAWWRLSLRGSPVSQWRLPASESTPQTSGGSGLTLTGFFATWSRELSSWRTAQGSLFQTGWERFSGPWPTSASVSSGQCVEVGACHDRARLFIVAAHPDFISLWHERGRRCRESGKGSLFLGADGQERNASWPPKRLSEPRVDRAGDGPSHGLVRHSLLGNGVVPAQGGAAFRYLWERMI